MRLSLLHRLENAHEDSVWAAAWAPTSNTLVTGSVDESVKLWQESADGLEQKHHVVSRYRRWWWPRAAACAEFLPATAFSDDRLKVAATVEPAA